MNRSLMYRMVRDITPKPIRRQYRKIVDKNRSHQEKRILITGWLGAFNLGDEMMLDVTLGILHKYHKYSKITLLIHKKDNEVIDKYENRGGCDVVVRRGITKEEIRRLVDENDTFFINGGALLDDRCYGEIWENNEKPLAYDLLDIALQFIRANKKVIFYGVSCNDKITNEQFIKDLLEVIEGSRHFSLRDKYSFNLIKKLGAKNIKLVDDIVIADQSLVKFAKEKKKTGNEIALIPILLDSTKNEVKKLISYILDTTDYNLKLVLFYNENDNDMKLAVEIRNELPDSQKYRVSNLVLPSNSQELAYSLVGANLVLSMRYHGTLFSAFAGLPTLCINLDSHPHYNNKNTHLAEYYNFNFPIINFSNIDKLDDDTLSNTKMLTDLRPTIHYRAYKNLRKLIKSI